MLKHINTTIILKYTGLILNRQWEPSHAPIICPNIITIPRTKTSFPAIIKIKREAIFVEKLSDLAIAVELSKSRPLKETPASEKNDPVPGPNIPSYQPIIGNTVYLYFFFRISVILISY